MSLQIFSKSLKLLNLTNGIIRTSNRDLFCGCQQTLFFSAKPTNKVEYEVDPETGEKKKKKTSIIPKITLLQGEQVSITTLDEAKKLSKRRDLKLVKIVDLDTKTQRPVYKLMTGSEYLADDLKQRELKKQQRQNQTIKGEKVLMLSSNISEHDLATQVRKVEKWLAKQYEVKAVINGDGNAMEKAEKVYNFIESSFKETGRILQKRVKGTDVKFQILPPKKTKSKDTTDGENL